MVDGGSFLLPVVIGSVKNLLGESYVIISLIDGCTV
jgi:hypothetical protein